MDFYQNAERWLLLFNCQTQGFGSSFSLLNPRFSIDAADIWRFKADADAYNRALSQYFRVVAHRDFVQLPTFAKSEAPNLTILPEIYFEAYHPDLCHVEDATGAIISGALHGYQSILALAAFNRGLSVRQAASLFNIRVYEPAGYLNLWNPSRDKLIGDFAEAGIDIRADFLRWGARRPFMYGVNHPCIDVVFDVARAFMHSHGVDTVETFVRPTDTLANGPCFPVYPEIGDTLGVAGSYLFKRIGHYQYLDLETFLEASFQLFSGYPRHTLRAFGHHQLRYDRVSSVLESLR